MAKLTKPKPQNTNDFVVIHSQSLSSVMEQILTLDTEKPSAQACPPSQPASQLFGQSNWQ